MGPNGAGKTTLLHLLIGLLRPTAGMVSVMGVDPRQSAASLLPDVAFVAQNHPLYSNYSVRDMLGLSQQLNKRWDMAYARTRVDEVGIALSRRVGELSGGEHAQLALTIALAKRPKLVLLDEPLASLDPLARLELVSALRTTRDSQAGLTVIVSSHIVTDLERFCDFLIVISASRVLASAPVEDLLTTAPRSPMVSAHAKPEGRQKGFRELESHSPLEQLVLDYLSLSRREREDAYRS